MVTDRDRAFESAFNATAAGLPGARCRKTVTVAVDLHARIRALDAKV
jgi:hypothetical protein